MSARWWDDAVTATAVLASVDDSDVVHGVATASLGLHALVKAAVSPLAAQTLVDRAQVATVAAGVPLEPVAKALAAATTPVLGPAAERYGVLLATELAKAAVDGVDRVVQGLTTRGVPMPLALARAAEAAGLPPGRTGRYIEALKEVTLPAVVVADAADRALMEYAKALGEREAIPFEVEVTKAAGIRFREEEHPRNAQGEFAAKPSVDSEQRLVDERTERQERRARRHRRAARHRQVVTRVAEPVARAGQSLREIAEVLLRRPEPAPQRLREPVRRAKPEPAPKPKPEPARAATTAESMLARPVGAPDTDITMTWTRAPHYWLVDRVTAARIAAGGVSPSALAAEFGQTYVEAFPGADLASLQNARMVKDQRHWYDLVALELPLQLPLVESHGTEESGIGLRIAGQAVLAPSNPTTYLHEDVTLSQQGYDIDEGSPVYGVQSSTPYPVLRLTLDNEEELEESRVHKAHPEEWTVHGAQVRRQVERDAEGQFATVDTGGEASERAARQERRARRRRRSARHRRAGALRSSEPAAAGQSLAQLVTTLQAQGALGPQRLRGQSLARPAAPRTAQAGVGVRGDQRAVATEVFAHKWGALVDITDLDALFELDYGDLETLEQGQELDVTMRRYEQGMPRPKPGHVHEVIDEWLNTGSEQRTVASSKDLAEATAIGEAFSRAAFGPQGLSGVEREDPMLVRAQWNARHKVWDVKAITYRNPKAMVYGSPLAMEAFARQDQTQVFYLKLVSPDVHDLADAEGISLSEVGPVAAPLFAVQLRVQGEDDLSKARDDRDHES